MQICFKMVASFKKNKRDPLLLLLHNRSSHVNYQAVNTFCGDDRIHNRLSTPPSCHELSITITCRYIFKPLKFSYAQGADKWKSDYTNRSLEWSVLR